MIPLTGVACRFGIPWVNTGDTGKSSIPCGRDLYRFGKIQSLSFLNVAASFALTICLAIASLFNFAKSLVGELGASDSF